MKTIASNTLKFGTLIALLLSMNTISFAETASEGEIDSTFAQTQNSELDQAAVAVGNDGPASASNFEIIGIEELEPVICQPQPPVGPQPTMAVAKPVL